MDATAGIAIGSRLGLGRVKLIDTVFLQVQAVVIEGKVTLVKKPTKEMLADFLTKHVDAATMLNCTTGLAMKFHSGREPIDLEGVKIRNLVGQKYYVFFRKYFSFFGTCFTFSLHF